jgi:hypothetical protein
MSKRLTSEESDDLKLKAMAFLNDGVVPVPFLGTTWLHRGPAYWSRRVGAVLLILLVGAIVTTLATGFTIGIYGGGASPARVVLTVVYALCVVPGLLIGRRTIARAPLSDQSRRSVAAPSGVIAVVLAPFATGVVLYVLLAMFGRDFIGERRAREASTPAKS